MKGETLTTDRKGKAMTHAEAVANDLVNGLMDTICKVAPHIIGYENEQPQAWRNLTKLVIAELKERSK